MSKSQRLPNFEILRIIAMLMVVVQHYWIFATVGRGVDSQVPATIVNYIFFQPFLMFCRGGVPLYFLITGYFLSTKEWKFNWSKLFLIWFYTFFYGLIFILIFLHNTPSIPSDPKSILKNILPLIGNKYWFIPIYLALAVFAPYLAKLSQVLERNYFTLLLIIMAFCGMTFWFDFPFGNTVGAGNGYTLMFAVFLFMTGAYIRKYNISFKGKRPWLIFLFTLLGCFLFCFITETRASGSVYVKYPRYNDLCIFVAIVFFIIVKDWRIQESRFSRFLLNLAPYVLGVYLIHENIYVRENLWPLVARWCPTSFSSWTAIPYALILPVAVFALCVLLDYIVKRVFQITGVENRLIQLFNRLIERCQQ